MCADLVGTSQWEGSLEQWSSCRAWKQGGDEEGPAVLTRAQIVGKGLPTALPQSFNA